jgi:polysaccharide chain length determinant protein (PEP-CTERM system associated)
VGADPVAREEKLMLPGKKYTPEDLIKILKKRFWIIVLPWAVIAAATAAVGRTLPDMYRSTATIQVVKPQVPESIVRPISTVTFQERLQATRQAILSRPRLEAIILEFNLYEEQRKTAVMEEVYARMLRDIVVGARAGDTFVVQYVGRDPVTVQKVAERLARHFKDESVREGERRAEGTNSFVESTVDDARRKLEEVEERRKRYMMQHAGELPTQLGANMQAVGTIQLTLRSIASALATDISNKATLERMIEAAENQTEPIAPPPPGAAASGGSAAQRLETAKAELAQMIDVRRLKPEHREVRAKNAEIARLTQQANQEALQSPVGAGAAVSPAEQARQARLASLRTDLEKAIKAIENHKAEEQRQRALLQTYQAKIDAAPQREAELVAIMREYDTLNRNHMNLVFTREQSSMGLNLERRQIGEQFNLLDPARLPERPFSPNRMFINLLGMIAGLTVGLGLVAFLEYRDSTFKTDYEVAGLLSLPVLAVVPLMRSDAERRAEFRKQLLLNLGLGSTVAVCLAVLAYTFVFLR